MKVTASGSVTGIAYWFTLQLFEDIVISTAPAAYPEVSSEGHREELYFITRYNYNPSYSGCIADSIFILFFRVIKITCTGSEGVFFCQYHYKVENSIHSIVEHHIYAGVVLFSSLTGTNVCSC